MTRFLSPSEAARGPAGAWTYLGKDVAVRRRIGGSPRPIGSGVHEQARRLRRPFLSWVASLGAGVPREEWWAGTLAWKAWSASDLFLLLCYQAWCRSLPPDSGLSVVVEDPWLLAQLRGGPPDASRLAPLALGALRRAKWGLRMAFARARLAGRWAAPADGGILLYSHLGARSFGKDGRWVEPFLTGLEDELQAAGVPCRRAVTPDSTGWEAELAAHRGAVIPLLTWATPADILSALLARVPTTPAPDFEGMPTGLLLERERLHDLSRSGRCAYVLARRVFGRLFAAARWRTAVLPWEGQPHERMLVLAARERGVRTVGSQHTTVPRMQLPFFCAPADLDAVPDVLMTTGPHPARVLAEGGVPASRLAPGGSRRFASLAARHAPPSPPAGKDVLVLLPIDRDQARHLLAALESAFPGPGPGFALRVRLHPAEPVPVPSGPPFAAADRPLDEELARCRGVVFTGSTAGLEALCAGRPTLRYRSDSLLNLDPLELLGPDELPTASDADIGEKVRALADSPVRVPERAAQELFTPLDPAAWRRAVLG